MNRTETIGDAVLYLGDALEILPTLGQVDAVIADPPYSSGGQFRSDRAQSTVAKYVRTDSADNYADFSGDNRDQRAFLAWCGMVFTRCYALTSVGGVAYVFSDWRQLPTVTDALQCGGFVWRNLVTWWKPGVRMQRGRFSASAEYIVCGSHGVPAEAEQSLQNVLKHAPVPSADRVHIAEKPVPLLCDLVGMTPAGALVLDPFMGSGTAGAACAKLRRRFIGIEIEENYFDVACKRIDQAQRQVRLFDEMAAAGHAPRVARLAGSSGDTATGAIAPSTVPAIAPRIRTTRDQLGLFDAGAK